MRKEVFFRRVGVRIAVIFPLIGLVLSGCSAPHLFSEQGGHWKVGKSYQIDGRWYTPTENWTYRKEGIASWYGSEFGGRPTANGEIFDPNALTAAHKTLPLPSLVRVTNLENNRTLVLRVNDRGPFVGDRLIDISRRGARDLGFMKKGTARVRVEVLERESRLLKQQTLAAARGGKPSVRAAPRGHVQNADSSVSSPQDLQPVPKPSGRDLPVVGHESWIQVGAFSSRENAEAFYDRVSSLHNGQIVLSPPGVTSLFRVRLGPFPTPQAAQQLREKLLKSGFEDSPLVINTGGR